MAEQGTSALLGCTGGDSRSVERPEDQQAVAGHPGKGQRRQDQPRPVAFRDLAQGQAQLREVADRAAEQPLPLGGRPDRGDHGLGLA